VVLKVLWDRKGGLSIWAGDDRLKGAKIVRELKAMISTQVGFLALKKLKGLVNAEKGQSCPKPQPPKH